MEASKNRVFFHELGHFIAAQLNHIIFDHAEVEKIIIVRYENDFTGETRYKIPEGIPFDTPTINLPQKLSKLIYGCYFQSLYLDSDLKMCFDNKNADANGKMDMVQTITALSGFKVSSEKRKNYYPYIEIEYFSLLKEKKDDFQLLFSLDPKEFFIEINDSVTEVDLHKLNFNVTEFVSKHTPLYLEFIERIEQILDWKNRL